MNVVVSAIVDPWVTTLSFVVALAMRIQGQILQILLRNQARSKSGAEQTNGEKPVSSATSTHKNTRQQADDLLAGTFLTY